jgi:thiamine phosphate synthase YjbQ (UPF0047 family)
LKGKPAVEGVLAAVGEARKKERIGEVDGDGMVILWLAEVDAGVAISEPEEPEEAEETDIERFLPRWAEKGMEMGSERLARNNMPARTIR